MRRRRGAASPADSAQKVKLFVALRGRLVLIGRVEGLTDTAQCELV
jgi:hypothetical protein